MANSQSGESVINRVVRILGAFTDESPSLSLRQLGRSVDLPVSTVHRLVAELEVEGLIVRDGAGLLRHGHRMWELASRGSRAARLREVALPVMEELLAEVGNYISLGVMEGPDVLYLERLGSEESVMNITKPAGRLPVHGCSAGLVFMAYATEAEKERFLKRRLEKLTESTVTDPGQLRTLLSSIRQHGYSSMAGIIVPESSGVSVPILVGVARPVATLSAIVPRGQERLAVLVPKLKMAARMIESSFSNVVGPASMNELGVI